MKGERLAWHLVEPDFGDTRRARIGGFVLERESRCLPIYRIQASADSPLEVPSIAAVMVILPMGMCVDVCVGACASAYVDACAQTQVQTRAHTCVQACIGMCMDMCAEKLLMGTCSTIFERTLESLAAWRTTLPTLMNAELWVATLHRRPYCIGWSHCTGGHIDVRWNPQRLGKIRCLHS